MELVLIGVMAGLLVGLLLGWIGGRMAGIGEGQSRERRRLEYLGIVPGLHGPLANSSSRGLAVQRPELLQDSMAEFTDPSARPRVAPPHPPHAPRALGPSGQSGGW